jgi:hypothetical protein
VTEGLVNSDAAGNFFVAGKYIGSDYAGWDGGRLVVIGRCDAARHGQPKTNKVLTSASTCFDR